MSEQAKPPSRFCIEKAFEKGPLHLLHSFRLTQLQSKINFFEGQVDPLLDENVSLKEQLIALSKLVESSTQILRNLLPTYDDPSKKLQLEMATIQQIAAMIKEDWHRMELRLTDNAKAIKQLREERDRWRDCFEEEKSERAREVCGLQELCQQNRTSFEGRIAGLESSLASLEGAHQEEKKQMRAEFAERVKSYQAGERQFERFKREARDREEEYEKRIARLSGEIDSNLLSFEETKKNIKAIYDKLMADKLSEQAEGFQMLLKIKEEEKMQIIISMNEAEDEFKRRAAQKEYEITKLAERNDSFRQEVGQLKGEIWNKQLQLDKEFEEGRSREQAIAQLQSENKKLFKKIQQNEWEYLQQREALQKVIVSKDEELGMLREQGSASVQKALTQKAALEKELSQKQQRLRQTLLTLRKKDETWQKEMDKLREQWRVREESIRLQLEQEQKASTAWSERVQSCERQKAELVKEQRQVVKRIEDVHREQQYILESRYQARMSELREAQEVEVAQMKALHQRELTQAKINASEQLREVMASCNRRMTEQEVAFLKQRAQYDQQIKRRQEQIRLAEKKLVQASLILEKNQAEHRQAIRQIQAAASEEKERLQQEMQNQMRVFQEEMEKQEARLSQIKAEMMKQIALLKEANAIDTIETRFLNEINKLKEQFAELIKKNELEYKMNEETLAHAHRSELGSLREGFNQDLIVIAAKIQQKSIYLNERLITGFSDSELLGMTEEQKKQYIIGKVVEIQKNSTEKEKRIEELEFGLDQAERNVEKRVKARKEELERQKDMLAKECNQKVQLVSSQCREKVAEAERDRFQHSQAMYVEFQALREHHQGLLNAINKKYLELETLFEERPSRMEDLTKIKELTNMQMKLDIEIQSYQKKMETANEIVKYLNLQLENYKDSYDIFGPNGQSIAGGIVGVSALRGSHNSGNNGPDTQHILEVIKSHRHGSEAKIMSQERKQLMKEQLAFRKWNETASPAIKELKIFQDDQSELSAVQSRDFSEAKEEKKYSYLMVEKGSERKNRFKTESSEKIEHQSEILINAKNFIKLIKGNQESPHPVVREVDQERRKSYRKRKLQKRQPTQGFDHYF